jgi:hypothetical protein
MAIAKKAAAKKSPAKKAATRSSPNDAIALLKADHREVKALFEEYKELVESEADDGEKKALAEKICGLLTVHATIEEEIFYPAAKESLDEPDLVNEATVEHASAKDLIAQIQASEPTEELYDSMVTVLGEYIDHHVKEEEGEMFPKTRRTDMDLKELGVQLQERKGELMTELGLTE